MSVLQSVLQWKRNKKESKNYLFSLTYFFLAPSKTNISLTGIELKVSYGRLIAIGTHYNAL